MAEEGAPCLDHHFALEEDADVFVKSCFAELDREAHCAQQQPDQESNTESSTVFGSSPDLQSASGSTCPETAANAYESPVSQFKHDVAKYGAAVGNELKLEALFGGSRSGQLVRNVPVANMFVPVEQAGTGRMSHGNGGKLGACYGSRGAPPAMEPPSDRPYSSGSHLQSQVRQLSKGVKMEPDFEGAFPQELTTQHYTNLVVKRLSVGQNGAVPPYDTDRGCRSPPPEKNCQNPSSWQYVSGEQGYKPGSHEYAEVSVDVVQARIKHVQRSCQSSPTVPGSELRQQLFHRSDGHPGELAQGKDLYRRPSTPCTPRSANGTPSKVANLSCRPPLPGNSGRNSPITASFDLNASPQSLSCREVRSPSVGQSPSSGRVESPSLAPSAHRGAPSALGKASSYRGPKFNAVMSVAMDSSCSAEEVSDMQQDQPYDSHTVHMSTTSFSCSRDAAGEDDCDYEPSVQDAGEPVRTRMPSQRTASKEVWKQLCDQSPVSYNALCKREGDPTPRRHTGEPPRVGQRSKMNKAATNYVLKSYGSDGMLPAPNAQAAASRQTTTRGHYDSRIVRHSSLPVMEQGPYLGASCPSSVSGDSDSGADAFLGSFLEESMLLEGDTLDNTFLDGLVDFDDADLLGTVVTANDVAQRKRMVANTQPKYLKRAKLAQQLSLPHGVVYDAHHSNSGAHISSARHHHLQLHRALSTGALEVHRAQTQLSYREYSMQPGPARSTSPNMRVSAAQAKNKSRDPTPVPLREFNNRAKPSFSDLVNLGLIAPGEYEFTVGNIPGVIVNVLPAGAIQFNNKDYNSISSFALAALKSRNPSRQACDGWKEVRWKGQRLEVMRQRCIKLLAQEGRNHKGGYL